MPLGKSKPLISILTVAKSNIRDLNHTYNNLKSKLDKDKDLIEWVLVLSGNFKNIEKNFLKSHKNVRVYYQAPLGIYHAMNSAIKYSKGNFSWFINSGDTIDNKNWRKLIDNLQKSSYDLHFFSVYIIKKNNNIFIKEYFFKNKSRLLYVLTILKMPPHHQGIIYRTTILKKNLFDNSFLIRGDYENLIRILRNKNRISIKSYPIPIATFYEGGVSNQKFIHYESIRALSINKSIKFVSIFLFIYFFIKFHIMRLFRST